MCLDFIYLLNHSFSQVLISHSRTYSLPCTFIHLSDQLNSYAISLACFVHHTHVFTHLLTRRISPLVYSCVPFTQPFTLHIHSFYIITWLTHVFTYSHHLCCSFFSLTHSNTLIFIRFIMSHLFFHHFFPGKLIISVF